MAMAGACGGSTRCRGGNYGGEGCGDGGESKEVGGAWGVDYAFVNLEVEK